MAVKYTAQQGAEIPRLAQQLGPMEAVKRKGVLRGQGRHGDVWKIIEQNSRNPQSHKNLRHRSFPNDLPAKSRPLVHPIRKSGGLGW